MCDKNAQVFISKCLKANKNIYSLGDFNQLLPVLENKHFNSEQYNKYMYSKHHQILTNYRNNFTKKYYDSLINYKKYNNSFLVNEIIKYRANSYKNADIIICNSNAECKEYNNLMLEHLNIKFGDIGCKIICMTNDLRKKDIYNSFDYVIKEINDDQITLDDETIITIEELKKNFEPAYAITMYKCQGHEYESFYIPDSSLTFIDGRKAYTIISRLKQDLTKETIKYNKENEFNFEL